MFSYGKSKKKQGLYLAFFDFRLSFRVIEAQKSKKWDLEKFHARRARRAPPSYVHVDACGLARCARSAGGGLGSQLMCTACCIDIHRCTAYLGQKFSKKKLVENFSKSHFFRFLVLNNSKTKAKIEKRQLEKVFLFRFSIGKKH